MWGKRGYCSASGVLGFIEDGARGVGARTLAYEATPTLAELGDMVREADEAVEGSDEVGWRGRVRL